MATLFPPIVDNLTPSFYMNEQGNVIIEVPFKHNRSVSSVNHFALKIRTVINGYAMNGNRTLTFEGANPTGTDFVRFTLNSSTPGWEEGYFQVGQFYKLQIAYIDNYGTENAEIGYFSTVTIAKFTAEPRVWIESINGPLSNSTNYHTYQYVGHFSETDANNTILDSTEKVYEYRFTITTNSTTVFDTGWLVHNASIESQNLQEYESEDYLEYYKEITGASTIHYQVRSNSGGEYNSPFYNLQPYTPVALQKEIKLRLDYDNGYVSVIANDDFASNTYYVLKTCGDEVTKIWQNTTALSEDDEIMKDLIVEQGVTYSYALCYVSGTSVYKTAEVEIYIDYEDIFLSDTSGRQLKVRLNPTISAIHETLLEQKVDTIGGRYPFFTRNGSVRYRDFQIGGLITLQVDEQRLFSPLYGLPDQPKRERTQTAATQDNEYIDELKRQGYTSSLSDYTPFNYYNERKFREEALEWLTNGEYKLFRSPSEGVLIVRLMNVNFVPFQGTSRMVYSFTAQAYEATGHDYDSLRKNGFFQGVS